SAKFATARSVLVERICDFLRQNGRSKALIIARAVKRDKSTVNRHLYSLQKSNQVFRTTENPPLWDLIEKKSDFEPEQKSQMSKDMCEEKHLMYDDSLCLLRGYNYESFDIKSLCIVMYSLLLFIVCIIYRLSELFEMISKIAEGGYGCIYKVKHKLYGKIYALKNAESEVKALAGLDHPNIVRYITSWLGPANWASNQERK
uniref:Protein kinase domain-containing protein n=1 Tax=Cyprinus carpio TaxID=7962 RepID=A0A8C1MWE3_CYPCA